MSLEIKRTMFECKLFNHFEEKIQTNVICSLAFITNFKTN